MLQKTRYELLPIVFTERTAAEWLTNNIADKIVLNGKISLGEIYLEAVLLTSRYGMDVGYTLDQWFDKTFGPYDGIHDGYLYSADDVRIIRIREGYSVGIRNVLTAMKY